MKAALRWLPSEVWMDIFTFPGISRQEMGQFVHKIGNRAFAEFMQEYLHNWGKRTLTEMDLDANKIIPQTPLPENIRFFECINVWLLDTTTLDFLQRINTIFTGVSLNLFHLSKDLPCLATVLDHLAPMIHGIHFMALKHTAIPLVEQHFAQQLTQTKHLEIHIEWGDLATIPPAINFCIDWLTAGGREPTELRMLHLHTCQEMFLLFITELKEQFLSATSPCTFAPCLFWRHRKEGEAQMLDRAYNLELENNIGEVLEGEYDEDDGRFAILRRPKDIPQSQLEVVLKEIAEKTDKSSIYFPEAEDLTMGPIDANDEEDDGADDGGQEEDDQQSTSAGQT